MNNSSVLEEEILEQDKVDSSSEHNEHWDSELNEEEIIADLPRANNVIIIKGDLNGAFNAGEGSITINDYERDMQSNIIEQNPNYSKGIRTIQISHEELQKNSSVYERIPLYDTALDRLIKYNLLIISGEKSSGKYSTAINLLLNISHNILQIVSLDGVIDIKKLEEISFEENKVYIIEDSSMDLNHNVDSLILTSIIDKLKRKNSFIAITVNDTYIQKDEYKYGIRCESPEDKFMLLKKHIDWISISNDININEDDFEAYVNENLRYPNEANIIAERIINDYKKYGTVDLQKIKQSFPSAVENQVKEWFEKDRSIDEFCFIISLAIFNKFSYATVQECSLKLKEILLKSDIGSYFNNNNLTRTEKVKNVNAHIFEIVKKSECGNMPIKCAAFDNDEYQAVVLNYVWKECDYLYKPLMKWIIDIGKISNIKVIKAVSNAVYILSKDDFENVYRNIIKQWIQESNFWASMSSVLTLSNLANDKEYFTNIVNITHHWCTLKNFKYNWTAIGVYGNGLGISVVDYALKDIYFIAQKSNTGFNRVINNAVLNIFQYGVTDKEYFEIVLKYLCEWDMNAKNYEDKNKVLDIFLNIALKAYVTDKKIQTKVPTILFLLRSKKMRSYIEALFMSAVDVFKYRKKACEFLYRVFDFASNNEKYKKVAKRWIIKTVISSNENVSKVVTKSIFDYKDQFSLPNEIVNEFYK